MSRHWKWLGAGLLALAAVGAALVVPFPDAQGGKPTKPPPEPPPPGTIYFDDNSGQPVHYVRGMNTDGSGKFDALPGPLGFEVAVGDPSSELYDRRPIWLATVQIGDLYPGHNEVFAVRPTADGTDLEWAQITEVNPELRVSSRGGPRWSNDGDDTFVSFVGDSSDGESGGPCLLRVNVTGYELALAFEDPEHWIPFGPDEVETVLVDDRLKIDSPYHDSSPDGSQVAYAISYLVDGGIKTELRVWDTATQSGALLFAGTDGPPRWSPDAARIAFPAWVKVRNKSKHGIVTIRPDGSDAKLILEDAASFSYWQPHWSPEGEHLAILVRERPPGPVLTGRLG